MGKSKEKTKDLKVKPDAKHLIGTLGEKSLHSALKDWYVRSGDLLEAQLDGFYIDIIRNNVLIEIQTANFSSQKRKLTTLIEKHPLRLVYPIALEKWIVRLASDGMTPLGRRKSPRRGDLFQLFEELVSIPHLIQYPNFSLEVLLIREEEIRCEDGNGSRRRRRLSIVDRRLIEVVSTRMFRDACDFLALIPSDLPDPFSTEDLGAGIDRPRWLAQKMTYCLRNMGAIEIVGKKGNALLYSR